ncbi:DUF4410 domain-containing protein [Paraburkholderia sp. GAS42]|jgi:hypothetical protein|uniref:DUF4410 domain-containing protein n=1 Tax=Paraburkholderia sp. GAS42 TaxID=3035135 RepID=UPI003D2105B1
MKTSWRCIALISCWLAAVATTSLAADSSGTPIPSSVVYVADFDLDAAAVKPDDSRPQRARRLIGGLLPTGPVMPEQDPQAHAQKIVASMAGQLTADLTKAGVDARRLAPGAARPDKGWLVHGVFLSVDEGNRIKRAVVGFGAGQGSLQVAVAIDDLATPGQPPLYEDVDSGSGGHKPGAAIKLNPYVVAAKFVLAGHDEATMITHTAQQISDAVVQRLQTAPKQ